MTEQLWLPSTLTRYSADDYNLLSTDLQNLYNNTCIIDMPPLPDLLLTPGKPVRTMAGWQYSECGLRALFGQLAPGLLTLVDSLVGNIITSRPTHTEHSHIAAINVLNEVLALRHRELANRKLIVRRHTNVIDGLLRTSNKHMDNHVFLEILAATAANVNLTFEMAVLQQRHLRIWFRDRTNSYVDAQSGFTFWPGFYAAQDESPDFAQRTRHMLRASPAVLWTNGCSFTSSPRVVLHSPKRLPLTERMGRWLEETTAAVPNKVELRTRLAALKQKPLGITDMKEDTTKLTALIAKLRKIRIKLDTARHVVQQTLQFGAAGRDSFVPGTLRTATPRTMFDFYCVLTSVCRKWPATYRESAEGLAHSILFDNK